MDTHEEEDKEEEEENKIQHHCRRNLDAENKQITKPLTGTRNKVIQSRPRGA